MILFSAFILICTHCFYALQSPDWYTPLVSWGQCSKPCGGGSCRAILKYCQPGNYVCSEVEAVCNGVECKDKWSKFSECHDPNGGRVLCGGGQMERVKLGAGGGEVEVIPCSLMPCLEPKTKTCRLHLIFAMDVSASIGPLKFHYIKQMVHDSLTYLSNTGIKLSAFTFDNDVKEIFSYSSDLNEMKQLLNLATYSGGNGCTANYLQFFNGFTKFYQHQDESQVIITVTDQPDFLKIDQLYNLSYELKKRVDMFAMQIGSNENVRLFSDRLNKLYNLKEINAMNMVISNILNKYCDEPINEQVPEVDDSILKNILYDENSLGCSGSYEWTEWSNCYGAECGKKGYSKRSRVCAQGSENFTRTALKRCEMPPCTTISIETTTPEIEVPITTASFSKHNTTVDCSECDFTRGQNWRPDYNNCHMYFICVRLPSRGDHINYRIFHRTCGKLFWNQEYATCVRKPPSECHIGPVVTDAPTTSATPSTCPYERVGTTGTKFRYNKQNLEMDCPDNMHFDNNKCTCIKDKTFSPPKCTQDMLLYFPYTLNFDDVTCTKAKGVSYGEGRVKIVHDSQRNQNVAEFDGKSRIEVAYMRNWFAGRNINQWTMTAWVNRVKDSNYDLTGIIDNGNCKHNATYSMYADRCSGKTCGFGGIATHSLPSTVTSKINFEWNTWTHLAVIYDGENIRFYINKKEVSRVSKSGVILSNHNPMYIGMQGCCNSHLNYFKGRIYDVRIWKYAISLEKLNNLP